MTMNMKTKDLFTIATVAFGTAAITVATFWAGSTEAGNDGDTLASKITRPAFLSHGIKLTLASAAAQLYKAGDQPAFQLTAVNTANADHAISIRLEMTAASPADMMSRVVRQPDVVWQQTESLKLKPGETRNLTLNTGKKLSEGREFAVSIQEIDPEREPQSAMNPAATTPKAPPIAPGNIVVLNFSTVPPVQRLVVGTPPPAVRPNLVAASSR